MIHLDNQAAVSERTNSRKNMSLSTSHTSLVSKADEVAALIVEAAMPACQ